MRLTSWFLTLALLAVLLDAALEGPARSAPGDDGVFQAMDGTNGRPSPQP